MCIKSMVARWKTKANNNKQQVKDTIITPRQKQTILEAPSNLCPCRSSFAYQIGERQCLPLSITILKFLSLPQSPEQTAPNKT